MPIYITEIAKHKFVCGLFWQSLSRPRELAKEAAALAKKIDSDLMVLRKDNATAQAGFAHTQDGARRKMFSLAAAVSKTIAIEGANYDGEQQPAHNWLGAFKLPDGKWAYFAVRDANFLPNGDFAGTKEEVIERLHGDYGLGGWNVVVGDPELEEYGFHNFNAKRIEDLLPKKKDGHIRTHGWWALSPVERRLPWKQVAIVCAASGFVGVVGALLWKQHLHKKAEEERERAIAVARQKMMGNVAAASLAHPWLPKPLPEAMTKACLERFTHLMPGGWQLEEYVCTPQQATYAWTRQGSTIDLLLAQVPEANIDIHGEKASYAEALTPGHGKDDALLEQKKLLDPLVSRLQLLGRTLRLTQAAPPAPPPPAGGQIPAEAPPPPFWKTYSFVLDAGGLPPMELATILSQPGIRIDKLVYRSGAWTIEGEIYAK